MTPVNETPSGILDFPVFPISENIFEKGTGNNSKGILICLVGIETPESQDFLEKVMAAVNINLKADAFTIHLEERQLFSFSTLEHAVGFAKALFFGVRPTDAGLNVNAHLYQPLSLAGKTFLFSDTLDAIQANPQLKRPLWEALKVVFQ